MAKNVVFLPKFTKKRSCASGYHFNMKKSIVAILALALGTFIVSAADGSALWSDNCASCHGKDGKGDTKMGQKTGVKDYTDPKVQAAVDDAKAFKSVKEGLIVEDKTKMKPFAEKMSDDDIKAAIAYLRTLKK
jgi:mono/diheme cytochrome c family protein